MAERIELLRTLMRAKGWDAVVVTGSDPHCSEYPAERWKQVEWLSGFTGEAGDLVVTLDHAGLWTDPRYFIQAEQQLAGTGIDLHKTRVPDQVLIPEWLERQFGADGLIAVDGLCMGADFAQSLPGTVISVPDLLGPFWPERPAIPQTPVFTVNPGESRREKLDWLRAFLRGRECDGILLTALDEIAWLLNVRDSDIEYNPLVISYLLVTQDDVCWYVLKDEVEDPESKATFSILESEGVRLLPYADIDYLPSELHGRLFVDAATLNYQLYANLITAGVPLEEGTSPIRLRKAVKNATEVAGMRDVHVQDGLAMERSCTGWSVRWTQDGRSRNGTPPSSWASSAPTCRDTAATVSRPFPPGDPAPRCRITSRPTRTLRSSARAACTCATRAGSTTAARPTSPAQFRSDGSARWSAKTIRWC